MTSKPTGGPEGIPVAEREAGPGRCMSNVDARLPTFSTALRAGTLVDHVLHRCSYVEVIERPRRGTVETRAKAPSRGSFPPNLPPPSSPSLTLRKAFRTRRHDGSRWENVGMRTVRDMPGNISNIWGSYAVRGEHPVRRRPCWRRRRIAAPGSVMCLSRRGSSRRWFSVEVGDAAMGSGPLGRFVQERFDFP